MRKCARLLLLVLCLGLTVFAVHAQQGPELLVNPYGGDADAIDCVRLHVGEDGLYLFLPAGTEPGQARIYFSPEATVLLDGLSLRSGDSGALLTEGAHLLRWEGRDYPLRVCISEHLPAVFLSTQSGSLDYLHADKENKEAGAIRVYENGEMTLDQSLKQIKGRGNSTWAYPKKPYNIKFDKKTALLGMAKAKKWTLLANYIDPTLLHNACGWAFAEALGQPCTASYRHVDLYANGCYLGSYVVCESVEVGENRVDIPDLDKANEDANPDLDLAGLPRGGTGPNGSVQSAAVKGSRKWLQIPQEPADISGGYLLELDYPDRYVKELCGFVTQNGQPVVLKSPECASQAEVSYIADLTDEAFEALYNATGLNSLGRHYSEYFDLDSLAAAYLVQELSMNFDAGFSSFFFYKPAGEEKFCFGPVWDMDNAFGSPYANLNVPLITTNLWWANQMGCNGIPSILAAANRHGDFRRLVSEKWERFCSSGSLAQVERQLAELAVTVRKSAVMNGLRWAGEEIPGAAATEADWIRQARICLSFVSDRAAALSRGLGARGAYLYYDLNGAAADRWATVSPILQQGDYAVLRELQGNGPIAAPEGMLFCGWSPTPDGSGPVCQPGDRLLLDSDATVLYAVWRSQRDLDRENGVNPFLDVAEGKYYYDPVLWAYYHEPQITSGTDLNRFSPNALCTREQIVSFLWLAMNRPEPAGDEMPFADLQPASYYYKAVLWAVEQGITGGVGGGRFGVGQPCTREQVVSFLWIAAGRPEPQGTGQSFRDISPEKYYYKPVLWAQEQGITGGVGEGLFGVGRSCSRAEAMTFLYLALGRQNEA